MSKEIKELLTDAAIAVVILIVVLPFFCRINSEPQVVSTNDTIYIHDTIHIVEPTPTKEEAVGEEVTKLPKAKSKLNIPISNELDSIGELSNDSAEVVIPITERTYEDSTYKAVVRGYNPELVSLDIYKQQTTVYRQQTRKPKVVVGIGPYAGFGNKGFNYGIAVNVSMPIWSW